MVARLTPDQKAACSNHVGVSTDLLIPFYGEFKPSRNFHAHAYLFLKDGIRLVVQRKL